MAGEALRLTNRADGFDFGAWHVKTTDARRGGLVVLHAIWGVTPHLKDLAEGFAEDGYEVIVPSLLDRADPGFPDLDIDETARARRMAAANSVDWSLAMGDIQAAIDALNGPVFALGFCFGGTAAWLAAARCTGLSAVACFYGGGVAAHIGETPLCPTQLHFGKHDDLIPMADVERVRDAYPDLPVFVYEAGHAFMAPSDHEPDSARLGRLRTLQLFHRASGKAEMGS
jgi:carboxymethylenebutenolidase